jgi:hypothetical protein
MLTSLTNKGNGSFGWFGGIKADFLTWAPNQPSESSGACAGISGIGLQIENCDGLHHFLCEEKPKTTTTPNATTL